MRRALPLALAVAMLAAFAQPATAAAAVQIRAVFLKEFDAEDLNYTIDQGALVTFRNEDPFFTHALSSQAPGLFSAEEIPAKQTRLVQGTPFLTTGSYLFEDPIHPEMVATLNVTGAGAPLPPDAIAPQGSITIKTRKAKRLLKQGNLYLRQTFSEAMDAGLVVRAGNTVIAKAHRTYLLPGSKGLVVRIATGRLTRVIDSKRAHGKASFKLRVDAFLSDAAGNPAQVTAARRLGI